LQPSRDDDTPWTQRQLGLTFKELTTAGSRRQKAKTRSEL